jgi:hypothetical protein
MMPPLPPPPVEDVEDAAAAGKEGDKESRRRRGGGGQGVAVREHTIRLVEDLAPLLSGLSKRGTRSSEATKPTAAGDVARLLGEVAEKSSHPRISLPRCYFYYVCTFAIFECGDARVCLFHWR